MVVKGPIIEVILVFKQVTKHSINEMRNSIEATLEAINCDKRIGNKMNIVLHFQTFNLIL